MKVKIKEVENYLSVLAETPKRFAAGSARLDEARLYVPFEEGGRPLIRVLAHLRAAADVWGDSIVMMLRLDEPEIAYLHPNERMKATGYASIDFQVSYKAYSQQRKELLGLLRNISAEAWSCPARIRGRTHTVFSETRRMTLHEADHWLQIDRLYKV